MRRALFFAVVCGMMCGWDVLPAYGQCRSNFYGSGLNGNG